MISKRPLFFGFLALSLGICSAFHIPFLFQPILPVNHIKNFTTSEPTDTYLTAIIVTDPIHQQAVYNRIKTTFTAKAIAQCRGEVTSPLRSICGLVNVVSFDDRDTNLEYADYILIKGDLSAPHSLNNPGSFNYREYLARKGVYSVIVVKKGDFIEVLKKDKANLIRGIFRFKRRLAEFIDARLPALEGNILKGVLLGDRSGIENDLKDKFVKTGTVHILVVSGLNVGIIASIFILIFRVLYLPRYISYPSAAILVAIYTVLTGAQPPVVRSAIMALSVLIGILLSRKVDILNCLGLSGIIILLNNPNALFDSSFQLSFCSILSIIILAPGIEQAFGVNACRAILYIKRSIAVSLAAWLGIMPIIAFNFNIISPVCILANIPVVFIVFLVTAGGMAFLATALFSHYLAQVFGYAAGFLTNILIKTVILFSKAPFGFFWTHRWNAVEITGFYIVLAIFGVSLYKKAFKKIYVVIAVLLFLNLLVWESIPLITSYQLQITVLDVGHGDAIVVEFPGRHYALIDTGKSLGDTDMGRDVVGPYLRARRINTLDAIFITHYDDDHSGGLVSLKKEFKVKNVFDNKALKRFDKISGFKDVEMLVLNPPSKHFSGADSDNNNSLVLKITYNRHSFLFCADIQAQAMEDILAYKTHLKSDFMKIAHHGAWVGPIEGLFINAVSPKVALISAAPKDVSAELLNELSSINCRVYKTYSDGAVTVTISKDGKVKLTTYNG